MEKARAMDCVASSDEVPRADLPFEFMLNAMRLKEGIPLAHFMERTGLPISALEVGLAQAESAGLVLRDLVRVVPTTRGFDFLNDLQSMFLPPARP
jgi:oxygen-independent coproporphyrinogen-3 oxidase